MPARASACRVNQETEETRIFQIWLMPNRAGVRLAGTRWHFPAEGEGLRVLAAGDGRDGALPLYADGAVLAGRLAAGQTIRHRLAPGVQRLFGARFGVGHRERNACRDA